MENEEQKENGINIEAIQNGYLNLMNIVKLNPQLERHPLFKIALMQIDNGLGKHSVKDIA